MNVIAICGSPRVKHTDSLLRDILKTYHSQNLIMLKDKEIRPCLACKTCARNNKCSLNDDMSSLLNEMQESELIILGSPTYFDNVTGLMKNFMDRCLPFYINNSLRGKKAILAVAGNLQKGESMRGNQNSTLDDQMESFRGSFAALEKFCMHLGLEVIEKYYSIDGKHAKL